MKLVRWIQESWRRRRRPTRRRRFADQFAAALVIKPLENRLVLNSAPILPEIGVALTANGSLMITGSDQADSVTVQSDTANSQYIINDNSASLSIKGINGATLSSDGHTAFVPFDSVGGNQIVENLGGGDDVFTVDFTLGGFSKSLVIDGGNGSDALAITGFGTIATYTPGNITGSGVISIGGDQISFAGLEPIDFNVSGGTFILDLAGNTADDVTLSQSTLVSDASLDAIDVAGTVDGVAFEDVRVRGASIVINTHGGDDTVTLNATGNAHNDVNLTVSTGGNAGDVISVNGTVAVSGSTTLDAAMINLNADISGPVSGSTATIVNVTDPGEVQDGLAVAATGGMVKLAAGTYDGAVSIDRAVSLTGSGDATTVVLSGPISITASGTVVIDGLTVNNSITDPGADLTIQNSIINAAGTAIDISGVNSALIQNNLISAGGDAVHGQGVTGNVTLLGNFITADRGVWLKDVGGQVQIGGLGPGEGNNILSFHEGIVLAGGIVGVVAVDGNLINAQGLGVDFEDGQNDFTARGNDITVDAAVVGGAGILVQHSTNGNVTIGGTAVGEGNTITATGTAIGVSVDTVLAGDVSVSGNSVSAMTTAVSVKSLAGDFALVGNTNVSSDTAEGVLGRDVAGNVAIQGNSFAGFGTYGLDLQNVGTDGANAVLIGGGGVGEGNTLFGPQTGFSLVNTRNLAVQNNSLVETTVGIYVAGTLGATPATLSGNSINTASTGTGIVLDGRTATTAVAFGSGNTVTGGTVGLLVEGAGVALPDLSLNNLVLDGQTDHYITLSDGALVAQQINGTAVTYGTVVGSTVSISQGYQIADRIVDAVDDGSLGFVRIRTGHVYVTENSFNSPTTTVANIQRAVNAAVSGDTIHIQAGSYTGDIDATSPGKDVALSPGDGPGQVVNSGSLILDAGDTLELQVNTTDAGTGYDNFVIVGGGTVTLNNATLTLTGSITTAPSDVVLIDNDGVDPVVGIFNGLPEQSLVNINGVNFRLTYQGGADGNDVVLRSGANADTFVTLVSNGAGGFNLLIYDFNAPSEDHLTIEADVANSRYIISDPNLIITTDIPSAGGDISHTVYVPFAVVTGNAINVNTLGGNDNLTIDYFRGNFSKTVNFDAGDGANDSLTLVNSNAVVTTYASVQHIFTSTASGSISTTGNGLVSYSNLEPILDNLVATSREFTFAGNNNDHIVLADALAAGDSLESINSEFSDTVTFRDPTASLTIYAGDGDDVIRINQLDSNYQAALSVLGQTGVDEIQQFADLTLATTQTSGDLFYQAEKITLNGDLHTPGTATYETGFTAVSVGVTEASGATISAEKLRFLGKGTFAIEQANDAGTLAANVEGTLAYMDVNGLTVGSVSTTSGIATNGNDVKLATGGDLSIESVVSLGAGDFTLNTAGNVTQLATGDITANGLQILGSGTVRLDTAANNVNNLAANHTGTISYSDSDSLTIGTVTDTAASLSVATSGITNTGSDVKLATGGDLSLEAAVLLGAGDLTLDTTGSVSQLAAGAITAKGLQILGSGTVRLDTASNNIVSLAANHTGTISYSDIDGLTVGTVTDTAATVTVSTNGITNTGSDVKFLTGGDLSIEAAVSLGTGDLTLNSTGNVSQQAAGAITADGLQILGSGTVRLDAAANNLATFAANHTGTISYSDTNGLTIGTVTDTAATVSTSTSGIANTGSDVKLTAGGDLAIEAAISLGAGDLTLNTTGDISQLPAGAITASGLQILGGGTVRLDAAANNVTTLAANHTGTISYSDANSLNIGTVTDTAADVSVSTSGINNIDSDVNIATGGDLSIDAVIALSVGNLTLNTTGSVSQLAAGAITANGLQILGSGTVRLDGAANNVTTLAANHAGTISYSDTNSLSIGTVADMAAAVSNSTSGITNPGSDVKLTTGGDLSIEAAVSLGAGDLTLNTTGNVSQLAAGAITANGLQILGSGTVRLDDANNVTTLAANHTGTISYSDTNSLTIGTVTDTAAVVSVSTTGITNLGSDVKLTTGGDLSLAAAIALATGDLTLNTTGDVSQIAAGTITANGLQILGNGVVRLDAAANNVTTLAANHTGTISYSDTDNLTIGTVTDTAAAVSVSTSGIINTGSDVKLTTGGDLSIAAAVALGAGDLTLNTTGNVSQLAGGAIVANGLQILGSGIVRLDTAANNVITLAANHVGTISYSATNSLIIGTVTDTAAAVSVSTSGITNTGFDVKLTTGGDLSIEAAVSLGAGDLTLNAAGNISQQAAGDVAASGLQILGSGTVRLDTAANNFVTLAGNHTGTISYSDTNSLTIGTVTDTAAAVSVSTSGITNPGSDVKLTTGGNLSIEAAVSLGGGDLTLNTTGNISQLAAGAITANGLQILGGGTVRLDAAANNVTTLAANHTGTISYSDINSLSIGTVTDTAAAVSVATSGITDPGSDVKITTGGDLAIEADISLGAGDLTLNATGNVSQLAAGVITANGLQILGSGTVRLDTAANNITTLAANHTGTISYSDTNGLTIGTVTDTAAAVSVSTSGITNTGSDVKLTTGGDLSIEAAVSLGAGDLTLNTTGNVSQLAAGTITSNGLQILGSGTVRLDAAANNVATLAANRTGTISYSDTNSLTIGTVTDTAAAVSVSTSGITNIGSDVKLTTGSDLSIEVAISLGVGDLTLNATGNVSQQAAGAITANGLQILGTGTVRLDTAANNLATLAANHTGTISYSDTNGLNIGPVTDTAAAVSVSTSGITNIGSDVKIAAGGDLSIEAAISLGTGDLTLNTIGNVSQLALGAITANGLQLLGSGMVRLDTAANDVATLAANHTGTVSYSDINGLTIGTVSDTAAAVGVASSGITNIDSDVKLATGGDLSLDAAVSLGAGDLTLNANGNVSQVVAGIITANGLQLLGSGTVRLDVATNDVATLAANHTGTISYADATGLTIGTVTDTAAAVSVSASGITNTGSDVKLATGGDLAIEAAISLGAGNLTLNTAGSISQLAAGTIAAGGLQILGSGTVRLDTAANNVTNLAANHTGTISYSDMNGLTIGTVTDTAAAVSVSTSGITTAGSDVKLATGGDLSIDTAISLGAGDLTLNATGKVAQLTTGTITSNGLRILGSGTVRLDTAANNVSTLAANHAGTISYVDVNSLTVGSVTDTAAAVSVTTSGISSTGSDVKLTTSGDLSIEAAISLSAGDLTMNITGNVSQLAAGTITASGLQLLGGGTVRLDGAANSVTTLAANHTGTISYSDTNSLVIGTVTDTAAAVSASTSGIINTGSDVKFTTGGDLSLEGAIALGAGHLTLNTNGDISQLAGGAIAANGLQILGSGTVRLDAAANNVITLAANHSGTISYSDTTNLTIGTVTDTAAASSVSTSGITNPGSDVNLVTSGNLSLEAAIALGAGDLTLNTTGIVTQLVSGAITANGLQILGSGTTQLDTAANNVTTLAANYSGSITYADATDLTIGTVSDTAAIASTSSSGIKTNAGDVTIRSGGVLTVDQTIDTSPGSGGLITVSNAILNAALIAGTGNITLNGGGADLIINFDQSSTTSLNYSADRDIIIRAGVTASGASSNIVLRADANNDGVGGFWLDEGSLATDAKLSAGQDISIFGSDISLTTGADSILIDGDSAAVQVSAERNISLTGNVVSGPGTTPTTNADIVINGVQSASAGSTTVDSADSISLSADQKAGTDLKLNDATQLTNSVVLIAGRDVTFAGKIDDDNNVATSSNLTITATRTVAFFGNVGATQPLNSLTITGAAGVVFGDADNSAGGAAAINTIRTVGDINIGSLTTIGNQGIIFDGGASSSSLLTLTTTGGGDVRLNGAVRLDSDLRIVISGTSSGDIEFTGNSPIDSKSGEFNDLQLNAGTGNITFAAAVGSSAALQDLTIEQARNVTFLNTLKTAGSFVQSAGTGTTTLHGASIGGQLDLTTTRVALTTSDVITTGSARILAAQSLTFQDSAGLNAGSSTITIGAGSGNLTQSETAIIQTTNDTENAVQLTVGNGGNANIADIRVGTSGGTIRLTAAGAIVDNSTGEGANLTGNAAILAAGSGIGDLGAGDLDTDVAILSAVTSQSNIFIQERDAIQLGRAGNENVNAANGSISIDASGSITAVQSIVAGTAGNQGPSAQPASVTLRTGGFIQINNLVAANHGSLSIEATSALGNVQINGELETFGGSIVVDAGGFVQLESNATANQGSITFHAKSASGNVGINGEITANGGSISVNAGGVVQLDKQAVANNGSIDITTSGVGANVQLNANVKAPQGSITITSAGIITIHDGVFLQSKASEYLRQSPGEIVTGSPSSSGQVSNAPPRFQIGQVDPNDVVLPADPTQEVRGTIGLGGNLEQGANLTLTVTWADGKTTVLTGLQAGDHVIWRIDENGQTIGTAIQHGSNTGQITIERIERTYSLTFLATLTTNQVAANFQVSNDRFIQLRDASQRDLNNSQEAKISTIVSNKDVARPPLVILEVPRIIVPEVRAAVRTEVTQNLIVVLNRYPDLNLARAETQSEGAILFLVAIGPDGEEGTRIALPVTELKNLSGLLERLKKAQIPNALYRLYYQEPGLPPQQVFEFRKTGNTIGDPVREPGRGANPVEEQPRQQPAAPAADSNQIMQNSPDSMEPARGAMEAAIAQAAEQSFTRAARLLRSWLR